MSTTAGGATEGEAGFTLIEALVALAVIATAAVGLLGAGEGHVARVGSLEARVIARLVAENRLAEIGLDPAAMDRLPARERMLGRDWRIEQTAVPTEEPDLAEIRVRVRPDGVESPVVRLTGFADLGRAR